MLKRFLSIACLLAAFATANAQTSLPCTECAVGAVSEGETCGDATNDECASAIPVTCGSTVCGQLYTDAGLGTTDTDWYSFDLAIPSSVTLHFNFRSTAMVSFYSDCAELPINVVMTESCVADSFTANLPAGVYYVGIMPMADPLTCDDSAYYNFSLVCGEAQPCDLDAIVSTEPTCPGSGLGGAVSAIAVGGVGPYFYIWDNGTTDDFQTGLEDGTYAVTIIDDNGCVDTASAVLESSCPVPDGASVNNITFTKATVSWIADDCATRYRVQVRQQGTTTWTTYQSMTNERVVKNLMPGTTYQYRVRVVCSPTGGASVSPWTGMQTFTTPGSCTAPSGLGATPSDTSAFVSWTAGTGVVKYRLRYRVQGTTTWTPMVIGGAITSKTINGLMANTTYEYQMRSQCNVAGTDFSPYTAIETFTTAMRLGQSDDATLALYPNPNTGAFNLTFTSAVRENVTVSVYDMLGRNVSAQALAVHNGLNNLALNLELAAGQYIVKVEGSANTHVMRFTVK